MVKSFQDGVNTFKAYGQFTRPNNNKMTLAIQIDNHYTGLTRLEKLKQHLIAQIPFEYSALQDAELHILGGDTYNGRPSVEIKIQFSIGEEEAVALLEAAGFRNGLLQTIM